jgi:2-dehydro-3-deoxygalactonokinase
MRVGAEMIRTRVSEQAARNNGLDGMGWRDGYIAVDWGTTNRRAYAVNGAGRCEEIMADDLGLLAVPDGGFPAAAAEIRARLGDRPMLLAGMVGSNRGWVEAPYVPAPAGAAELAAAIRWLEPGKTGIVPGVSQAGAAGADVMRGEEVQVVGAVAAGLVLADALVCHPGTHAKWIRVENGRIAAFRTMMTGEMFSLLKRHSILADQLQGEVSASDPAFAEGLGEEALLSALFGIRARRLVEADGRNDAAYASGLLIGADVRSGLALHRGEPIALVGRPDLCALYAAALGQAGQAAEQVDGAYAFLAGMHLLTELI